MMRRPPRSTHTDTLFPYTTLFRSRRPAARSSSCLARTVGIRSDWRLPKDGPACLAVPIPHTEDASQAGVEQRQVFRCPVEPFALRWVFVLGEGGAVSLEDVDRKRVV